MVARRSQVGGVFCCPIYPQTFNDSVGVSVYSILQLPGIPGNIEKSIQYKSMSTLSEFAAKWWANHLRDGSKAVLASDVSIDVFEAKLSELIEQKQPRFVDVDYHPDLLLSEAAESAGLDLGMTRLPWKTTMMIDHQSQCIKVAGYGANSEIIYQG